MFPTLAKIGALELHSYGLMIALGFLAALYLMQRDAPRWNIDPRLVSGTAFWSLFIGIWATRALHIVMYPENYSWNDPVGWVAIWRGGLVFQGAIPAVLIYIFIVLRWKGLPFFASLDLAAPYVPLAQAFGRVGCFLNGCCYGERCGLPWAVRFPKGSPVYVEHINRYAELSVQTDAWSYPVHPTQLYSVLGLLLIFAALWLVRRKCYAFAGITLALYLALYGVMRFIVEFYRGDNNPTGLGFGVRSNQQIFSLGMVAAGLALFAYLAVKKYPPGDRGKPDTANETR